MQWNGERVPLGATVKNVALVYYFRAMLLWWWMREEGDEERCFELSRKLFRLDGHPRLEPDCVRSGTYWVMTSYGDTECIDLNIMIKILQTWPQKEYSVLYLRRCLVITILY